MFLFEIGFEFGDITGLCVALAVETILGKNMACLINYFYSKKLSKMIWIVFKSLLKLDLVIIVSYDHSYHMWSRNCLPFRNT